MFHVEHSERAARWLVEGAAELGVFLADEAIPCFLKYLDELKKWNRKVNLTALRSDREIVVKHFLDSLFCCKALQIPEEAKMLDVGSGAGFPGIPIKIVSRSIRITLLEPSQKKTAFLRHMVGLLGLDSVTVLQTRIQGMLEAGDFGEPFTHVVSRALNPRVFWPLIQHTVKPGGLLVLWRGRTSPALDTGRGFTLLREIHYLLPFGYGSRTLAVFSRE